MFMGGKAERRCKHMIRLRVPAIASLITDDCADALVAIATALAPTNAVNASVLKVFIFKLLGFLRFNLNVRLGLRFPLCSKLALEPT